jgi:hypothetical protein
MSKKDGGQCISNKAKLPKTSNLSESIYEGFQTLLQNFLNTLEILMTTIQGLGTINPFNANGKIC